MSSSEIKEILQKTDICPGEIENRKLTDALPIIF